MFVRVRGYDPKSGLYIDMENIQVFDAKELATNILSLSENNIDIEDNIEK